MIYEKLLFLQNQIDKTSSKQERVGNSLLTKRNCLNEVKNLSKKRNH